MHTENTHYVHRNHTLCIPKTHINVHLNLKQTKMRKRTCFKYIPHNGEHNDDGSRTGCDGDDDDDDGDVNDDNNNVDDNSLM